MLNKRDLAAVALLFLLVPPTLGGGKSLLESPLPLSQQVLRIKGKVLDIRGESIIGATVMEKGTTNGTVTDIDGNFILTVQVGAIIQVSYVGYGTQEVKASNGMIVTLEEDA